MKHLHTYSWGPGHAVAIMDENDVQIGKIEIANHLTALTIASQIVDAWNHRHETLRAIEWQPIETAPRDRTLIDCMRDEIRFTDCHFEPRLNCFVRIHGYPSMTEVFTPQPSYWRPRPDGLVDPYTGGRTGKAMER